MADYTIAPNSNGQPRINGLPFPIPYVGSTGYALYNYLQEISADKIIPYMKDVSTAEFISGNYTSFQSPVGYTIPPYTLPFFETSEILLNADTIKVFTPHKGYIIGSPTDKMTGNFPIRVFEEDYNSNSVVIPPLGFSQTFRIIIYKTASSLIDFTNSNITNNGLELGIIAPLTRIEFECQRNDSNSILITRWITPSVQDLPVAERQGFTSAQQGNVTASQNPSVKISIGEASYNSNLTILGKNGINQGAFILSPDGLVGTGQVKDAAITAPKLASGAVVGSLGYTPANVGGTNWNANAVPTSLGYTPAQQGNVTASQNPSVKISIGEASYNSNLTILGKNGINQGAFILSPDGLVGTGQVKDAAITASKLALGYTPANVGGTNWNANAVATSLGYTPAKIGDSWISFRASYTSGAWSLLAPYTFSSSPDLGNFSIIIPLAQTVQEYFLFSLKKNAIFLAPSSYSISVQPRFINRIVSVSITPPTSVIIGNLDKAIGFNTGGAVIWSNAIPTDVDIIIYFSKNL